MKIVVSLLLLVSAVTTIITNGCGNTNVPTEEGKKMTESVDSTPGSYMTGRYKTATFALG